MQFVFFFLLIRSISPEAIFIVIPCLRFNFFCLRVLLTRASLLALDKSIYYSNCKCHLGHNRRLIPETRTNSDRHEFVLVSTHFFSCVYMGPAWKWTQTGLTSSRSLTRRELLWYRTETLPFSWKKGNESQTGSINSMFLCMAPSFLLILLITSVNKTSKLNLFYWSRPA